MTKIILPESKSQNPGSPLRAGMRMYSEPDYALGIGAFDTLIPQGSREALAKSAYDTKDGKYTASWGYVAFREAVLRYLASRGMQVPYESIIGGNGASQLLSYICAGIVGVGNVALAPLPSYATFGGIAKSVGAKVRGVAGEALVEHFTPDVKMLYVCTPNNPDDRTLEEEVLRRYAELCVEKNIVLCVDFTYNEHYYGGRPPAQVLSDKRYWGHIIYVFSFSKSFSLMKYRVGFMVCPDESRTDAIIGEALLGEAEEQLCPNFDGMVAAIGALTEADEYTAYLRKEMADRMTIGLEALLNKHRRVSIEKPTAGGYLFPRIEGVDTVKLRHFIMTDPMFQGRRTLFTPGSGFHFGCGGKDQLRIALAIGGENLGNGIRTIVEAIDPFLEIHGEIAA